MLRTAGLPPRGVRRMLLLEALLLGFTPILLSLPAAAVLQGVFLSINEVSFTQWMIAFIYLLTFFILRASTRLVKVLGETGNNVMMRLMGLILMVIAVECFVSGVKPILVDILNEGLVGLR